LILQATENLLRQGLSDAEKKRIVGELAKRCHFSVLEITDRLKKSESWVRLYYPDECKDKELSDWGKKGGRPLLDNMALIIKATCEYCSVSTSEPKEWENHTLCPLHYSQALEDPARFKRFFGFQQQQPVIGEHIKSEPLDSWEHRKAQMSPEHSEMEQTIMQLLLDKGVKPILTNQKYCLLSTTPDFVFPALNLAVYLDGTAVHNGKQIDRDDELRGLLQKRHGMRILSIPYSSRSQKEVDRILNEIVKEVKKE